jgi:hypothetical protein
MTAEVNYINSSLREVLEVDTERYNYVVIKKEVKDGDTWRTYSTTTISMDGALKFSNYLKDIEDNFFNT